MHGTTNIQNNIKQDATRHARRTKTTSKNMAPHSPNPSYNVLAKLPKKHKLAFGCIMTNYKIQELLSKKITCIYTPKNISPPFNPWNSLSLLFYSLSSPKKLMWYSAGDRQLDTAGKSVSGSRLRRLSRVRKGLASWPSMSTTREPREAESMSTTKRKVLLALALTGTSYCWEEGGSGWLLLDNS